MTNDKTHLANHITGSRYNHLEYEEVEYEVLGL